ncbi:hypothetical protein STEG23_000514, partial [Scotinomys teguina]
TTYPDVSRQLHTSVATGKSGSCLHTPCPPCLTVCQTRNHTEPCPSDASQWMF